MIELGKHYVTRDGRQVRIYAVDHSGAFPVAGAVLHDGNWITMSWHADGRWARGDGKADLIERKPRIKRTIWVAMYEGYCTYFLTRPINLASNCIACVKVDIDCEHGEGL